MTTLENPTEAPAPLDEALTRRTRALVDAKTTEYATDMLEVPLSYYRDQGVFERELSLLRSTPLALAMSAQIKEPHSFATRTVLGTHLLFTRDADGAAHVFLNYCRHRGARPAEGAGVSRRFTCPYHAWSYDTSGCLASMPGKKGFAGMDKGEYGLVELSSEERHGFVWAVLDEDIDIDLDEHLGAFDAELSQWGYENYGYLTEREFDAEVSWKNSLEAFAESYHFPFVHGQSVIGMNTVADTAAYDEFGPHHRLHMPFRWIADLEEGQGDWSPGANGGVIYWVYPNLILANSPVGVEIIDMLPVDDPVRCTVRHSWMSIVPAADDATRSMYEDIYEQVHAAVRDEDYGVLPGCGAGVRAGQHDHMILGRNEIGVQHMVRVMAERLGIDLTAQ
ncbi:aromatic ring-hydroxylating oxygenase subunit alpha [Nocardioides acrostichi]|uniref:Aromatic ring-hydroxylating dioxygenase subunit alpha n=1 Tax=Nocardioides acrostichi TaxID=2784339 RepID=A0A930V2B0_9ACTN|nr:aromatic ring-hydroxylating dioxygenase subunit alpha [Nocardioides acrostichi]MBF4162482.1 aromatic ring-hydroxylating dioxygenase subunit alpha [Nocardioides acrostichi]